MSANYSATVFRYWTLGFSLFLMACASTPHVFVPRFTQERYSSRDGRLRYRLPTGWINATGDAPSADNLVWLVKSDNAAMLLVREVTVDEITREEIKHTGLGRLGELLLSLALSEQGASMEKRPAAANLSGLSICTYEYVAGHPGERFYVVLVDTGGRVYEVSSRAPATEGAEMSRALITTQEAFVQDVLW